MRREEKYPDTSSFTLQTDRTTIVRSPRSVKSHTNLTIKEDNMTIKEMRELLGISRAEFSRRYDIPIRTLENWESGTRTPPKYVISLLEKDIIKEERE